MPKIGAVYKLNNFHNVKVTRIKYNCVFFKFLSENDYITFLDIKDFKKVFMK